MSGQQRAVPVLEGDGRGRGQPSFALVESKLRAPWVRPGIVARKRLVERLLAAGSVPLVCVVAPAGYGKTTLLAQWGRSKADRVGWVSLDARDNDPVVLLTYLAVALDRIEPVDPGVFRALASPSVSVLTAAVPRLVTAVAAMFEPVALVLDQVESLEDQRCLDAVAELALALPAGAWSRSGRPSSP